MGRTSGNEVPIAYNSLNLGRELQYENICEGSYNILSNHSVCAASSGDKNRETYMCNLILNRLQITG